MGVRKIEITSFMMPFTGSTLEISVSFYATRDSNTHKVKMGLHRKITCDRKWDASRLGSSPRISFKPNVPNQK